MLDTHILPAFGRVKLEDLRPALIRAWLLRLPLARPTIGLVRAVFSACIEAARQPPHRLVAKNVCHDLGKLFPKQTGVRRTVTRRKAFTADELATFLAPRDRYDDLWLLGGRSGLRIGEALALRASDCDLGAATAHIERQATPEGQFTLPKGGKVRTIRLSAGTVAMVRRRQIGQRTAALQSGVRTDLLFHTATGRPIDRPTLRAAFARRLRACGLPSHHTPHDLRHTCASLLVAAGTPLAFVKDQLGHSSIKLTADLYGGWLPKDDLGGMDALDGGKLAVNFPATDGAEPPARRAPTYGKSVT